MGQTEEENIMSVISWYGHSAFKIESEGSSVLIDPFFAPKWGTKPAEAGKPDMVLLTHDHGDHVGDTVDICKKTGAMLGCIVGTAAVMVERGVPERQILNGIGYNIGGTESYKGISATMTQAFHSSDSGAPAGYIIRMPDGLILYHAGDTGIFSSMAELGAIYGIQVGLLPIGGVFTMDATQAAYACRLLGCKLVIPMHWGTFPVLAQSTEEFKEKLAAIAPECHCLEMKAGQSCDLSQILLEHSRNGN